MRIAIAAVFVLLAVCACDAYRSNEMRDNNVRTRMDQKIERREFEDAFYSAFFTALGEKLRNGPSSSSSSSSDNDSGNNSLSTEELNRVGSETGMTHQQMYDHLNLENINQKMTKPEMLNYLKAKKAELKSVMAEVKQQTN